VFLGIDQDRFVDAVELDVGDAQIIQGGADQIGKLFQSFSLKMQIAELVVQEIALFRFRAEFPAGFMIPPPRSFFTFRGANPWA